MMKKTFVCLAVQRKQREIMRDEEKKKEESEENTRQNTHKRTFLIINASVLRGGAERESINGYDSCQYGFGCCYRYDQLTGHSSLVPTHCDFSQASRGKRLIKSADNFYICHKFCDSRKSIFCILFVYLKFLESTRQATTTTTKARAKWAPDWCDNSLIIFGRAREWQGSRVGFN